MYKYGLGSTAKISQLEPQLQAILHDLIKVMDVTIVWAYRGELEQNIAYDAGKSKLKFPESKHNRMPARAVDVAPYSAELRGPDWKDTQRFYYMDGIIRGIAQARGIKIRGGWDWDNDGEIRDQDFNDLAHFELEE